MNILKIDSEQPEIEHIQKAAGYFKTAALLPTRLNKNKI